MPMSEFERERSDSASESPRVRMELVAWVTRFAGGDGAGRKVFDEAVSPGDTVRSLLSRLSDRHPQLREALWDGAGTHLSEHIEVLVNDAVLGLTHDLDTPVQRGDRITLVGQYVGG